MKKVFTIIFSLIIYPLLASDPGWKVNSADYSNSMNIVAVVKLDGIELHSEYDVVAAFAGSEIRGVEKTGSAVSGNRYYVFLTIYSNKNSGEEITFRLYKKDSDSIIQLTNKIQFVSDKLTGSISDPYILINIIAKAEISSFGFQGVTSKSTITTNDKTIVVYVPLNTDVTSLVSVFNLSEGATASINGVKLESGITPADYTNPVTIEITAADGTKVSWVITVIKSETLGLNQSENDISGLLIFPNPADIEIFLNFSSMTYSEATIYDNKGHLVKSEKIESGNTRSIDVRDLAPGIYYMIVTSDQSTFTKTFVRR
jgi:hypothetical protein